MNQPHGNGAAPPAGASRGDAAGLAAVDLSVRAGARELVRGLSMRFVPGEVLAILGRNGSGKTLTLHTLAGLRPSAVDPPGGRGELTRRP